MSRDTVDGLLVTRSLAVKQRLKLPNTKEALTPAFAHLLAMYPHITAGVESTGMYHRAVVEVYTDLNLKCKLINPILTKQVVRHSIRKRKTDREDALVVAKFLIQGEGKTVTTRDVIRPTCTLARSARKVTTLAQAMRLHLRHVERLVGELPPELQEARKAVESTNKTLQTLMVRYTTSPLLPLLTSIPGVGARLAAVILAETNVSVRRIAFLTAVV